MKINPPLKPAEGRFLQRDLCAYNSAFEHGKVVLDFFFQSQAEAFVRAFPERAPVDNAPVGQGMDAVRQVRFSPDLHHVCDTCWSAHATFLRCQKIIHHSANQDDIEHASTPPPFPKERPGRYSLTNYTRNCDPGLGNLSCRGLLSS